MKTSVSEKRHFCESEVGFYLWLSALLYQTIQREKWLQAWHARPPFFFTILYFWDHTYWCLMCSLFCVWTQKDVEHGIHGSLRCIFVVSGWNRTTYLHVLVVENFLLKLIFVGQTNICWEFKVGEDFCLVWTLFIWSRKKDIRIEHLALVLFLK